MNGNEIKVFGRMAKFTARLADSARAISLCGPFSPSSPNLPGDIHAILMTLN